MGFWEGFGVGAGLIIVLLVVSILAYVISVRPRGIKLRCEVCGKSIKFRDGEVPAGWLRWHVADKYHVRCPKCAVSQ